MSDQEDSSVDLQHSGVPFTGEVTWWNVASLRIDKTFARISFLQGAPVFQPLDAKEMGDTLRPVGSFISTPETMISLAGVMARFGAQWTSQWGTPERMESFRQSINDAIDEGIRVGEERQSTEESGAER